MKKETILIEFTAIAFFLLFVYTGVSKIVTFDLSYGDLKRSPYLGTLALPISIFIPVIELIVAALLVSDKTRSYGIKGSLTLMAVFTLYVGFVLLLKTSIPCTCGGIIRTMSWPMHFAFNLFFLALAIIAVLIKQNQLKFIAHNRHVAT